MRVTQVQLKAMTGKGTFDKNGRLLSGKEASRMIGGGGGRMAIGNIRLGSGKKSSKAEQKLIAGLLERAGTYGTVKLLDSERDLLRTGSEDEPRNQHGNKKVDTPDGKFDSGGEYCRWLDLKKMRVVRLITQLERQVPFDLTVNTEFGTFKIGIVVYDFSYVITKSGEKIIEDFKGFRTRIYRFKKKLFEAIYGMKVFETTEVDINRSGNQKRSLKGAAGDKGFMKRVKESENNRREKQKKIVKEVKTENRRKIRLEDKRPAAARKSTKTSAAGQREVDI